MPIGAIAKEHGPHLPLNTDWLIARALAQRVAEALPIVVAPVVSTGYYPAFTGYAGSQHLSATTFIAVIEELIGNLIGQGARRIALLNTGVSTEAPLRIACRNILAQHGVSIPCADIRNLGRASDKLLEQKTGGHANEAETSIMLARDSARVDLRRAVVDYGDAPPAQPASLMSLSVPAQWRAAAAAPLATPPSPPSPRARRSWMPWWASWSPV
jgi:creatinine amidohydrolase